MSNLRRLQIRGIRSYTDREPESIEFGFPLTIILGKNGSGKTTIIEALKFACTGGFPPLSDGGKSFVHDPKVAGGAKVVRAQIKLGFESGARQPFLVIRNMQLTQKKKKFEFKQVDASLVSSTPDGRCESISSRCADMNQQIPRLLGVSKAVLENVIFCHQEDSNWPLSESRILKQKFDDIFSATRYTKALEVIRKLQTSKTRDVRVMAAELKVLENDKSLADRRSKELRKCVKEMAKKAEQLKEASQSKQTHSDSLDQLQEQLAACTRLQRRVEAMQTKKVEMEKECKLAKKRISKEIEAADAEVRVMYARFRSKISQVQGELDAVVGQMDELKEEQSGVLRKQRQVDSYIVQIRTETKEVKHAAAEFRRLLDELAADDRTAVGQASAAVEAVREHFSAVSQPLSPVLDLLEACREGKSSSGDVVMGLSSPGQGSAAAQATVRAQEEAGETDPVLSLKALPIFYQEVNSHWTEQVSLRAALWENILQQVEGVGEEHQQVLDRQRDEVLEQVNALEGNLQAQTVLGKSLSKKVGIAKRAITAIERKLGETEESGSAGGEAGELQARKEALDAVMNGPVVERWSAAQAEVNNRVSALRKCGQDARAFRAALQSHLATQRHQSFACRRVVEAALAYNTCVQQLTEAVIAQGGRFGKDGNLLRRKSDGSQSQSGDGLVVDAASPTPIPVPSPPPSTLPSSPSSAENPDEQRRELARGKVAAAYLLKQHVRLQRRVKDVQDWLDQAVQQAQTSLFSAEQDGRDLATELASAAETLRAKNNRADELRKRIRTTLTVIEQAAVPELDELLPAGSEIKTWDASLERKARSALQDAVGSATAALEVARAQASDRGAAVRFYRSFVVHSDKKQECPVCERSFASERAHKAFKKLMRNKVSGIERQRTQSSSSQSDEPGLEALSARLAQLQRLEDRLTDLAQAHADLQPLRAQRPQLMTQVSLLKSQQEEATAAAAHAEKRLAALRDWAGICSEMAGRLQSAHELCREVAMPSGEDAGEQSSSVSSCRLSFLSGAGDAVEGDVSMRDDEETKQPSAKVGSKRGRSRSSSRRGSTRSGKSARTTVTTSAGSAAPPNQVAEFFAQSWTADSLGQAAKQWASETQSLLGAGEAVEHWWALDASGARQAESAPASTTPSTLTAPEVVSSVEAVDRVVRQIDAAESHWTRAGDMVAGWVRALDEAKGQLWDRLNALQRSSQTVERLRVKREHQESTLAELQAQEEENQVKTTEVEQQRDTMRTRLQQSKDRCSQFALLLSEIRERLADRVSGVQTAGKQLKPLATKMNTFARKRLQRYQTLCGNVESVARTLRDLTGKMEELEARADSYRRDIAQQGSDEANLAANIEYRSRQSDLQTHTHTLVSAQAELDRLSEGGTLQDDAQRAREAVREAELAASELGGQLAQLRNQKRVLEQEIGGSQFRDISQRYLRKLIECKTLGEATQDLASYYKALDKALMHYHSSKMQEINDVLREYWYATYQGNDIDEIYVSCECTSVTSGRRNYNYAVMMKQHDVGIPMRGHCSAGQKVLACLLIRLALAETLCLSCGVLALDEPTTNLDSANILSFADALSGVIHRRRAHRSFQLVIITHDEEFVGALSTRKLTDHYFRVVKDQNSHSRIIKTKI